MRAAFDAARLVRQVMLVVLLACSASVVVAQDTERTIQFPTPDPHAPIFVQGGNARRWGQGQYDVWWLDGPCTILQGSTAARAKGAILWIKHEVGPPLAHNKVIAYLEGDVVLEDTRATGHSRLTDKTWFGYFHSIAPLQMQVPAAGLEPLTKPEIFERGMKRRLPQKDAPIQPAKFQRGSEGPQLFAPSEGARDLPSPVESIPAGRADRQPQGGPPAYKPARRLRAYPRTTVKVQAQWFPTGKGDEWVAVITTGSNLVVDGVNSAGAVDMAADRIVLWTCGKQQPDLSGQSPQEDEMPLEIYLEGNVVFRQGERIIYADKLFYDADRDAALILDVEMLSPAPNVAGLMRLKTDVLRQTGPNRFSADRAMITSSRMDQPAYRLMAHEVEFTSIERPMFERFTGEPIIDPLTGEQAMQLDQRLKSKHNTMFLGRAPIFYWPRLSTNLEQANYYLQSFQFQNDLIFGQWIKLQLNAYQLLGMKPIPGTDWYYDLDYASKRGVGGGTYFDYYRQDLFGFKGLSSGLIKLWGINDKGFDLLDVQDRKDLIPENRFYDPSNSMRYRLFGRHRQVFTDGYQFTGEVGAISDRNFLEQYFEMEWDQNKDQTTGAELKRLIENRSWSVTGDVRVNPFFTQTNWWPRVDHFTLGQSLLADKFTWFEHSSAGYARLQTASTPLNPSDAAHFRLLPWEANEGGGRYVTRQEIDAPVQIGAVKFVPYTLGEFAHWDQDLQGNQLDRLYGQAGLRASIPFWSVNHDAESTLLNVHGLAHKVVFDVDASIARTNHNLSQLPLYDPVDDDSQEHFRRRFAFNTFGGVTPMQFDERFYALRSGLGSWVTSPSTEIANDLTTVRMGTQQRLQTKRGPIANQRIMDWMIFDASAVYFPQANQDNFGQAFGMAQYNYVWHIGDRLTMLSDGYFDFFQMGEQTIGVGAQLTRPPRGSLYAGFRSFRGPFRSEVVSLQYSYKLSPKWISTAGTSFVVTGNGNISQSLALTRVGEAMLVGFQFQTDYATRNVGASLMIEPRFSPNARQGRIGGYPMTPAGLYGLE